MTSCTCDCTDGFSGSSCESELQSFELTLLIHVHSYLHICFSTNPLISQPVL